MPRRPLPNIPHGPRRTRNRPTPRLLACPRVSPEWEFSALQALMKPQLKDSILHRNAMQKWTASQTRALDQARNLLRQRLGTDLPVHRPADGDYHFISEVIDATSDEARAWAAVISHALPEHWLVAGPLFVKNGRFYRRRYGYKLSLVPATNIHLPRALRGALKGCL